MTATAGTAEPGTTEPGNPAGAGVGGLAAQLALIALGLTPIAAGWLEGRPALTLAGAVLAGGVWLRVVASARAGRVALAPVLVGAVLLRVGMLAGDPGVSDDLHRYAWEARVVLAGISPYAHAPDDRRLDGLRERFPELAASVNHPQVSAAYPPGAQAWFVATTWLVGEDGTDAAVELGLRVGSALWDLLLVIPLLVLLERGRAPPGLVATWAWCPLVVLEFAGSAHLDSLALLAWLAGLAWFTKLRGGPSSGRGAGPALLVTFGALVKVLPLVSLPFLWRDADRRGRVAVVGATMALVGLALLPLFRLEGGFAGLTAGLGEYGFRWQSTSLVYRFVQAPFDALFDQGGGWLDARRLGRALVAILWLGLMVRAWRRRADPIEAAALAAGSFVVLTPTLHPWYLCWVVPFLALRPSRAFGYLVLAGPLLYVVVVGWKREGLWQEPWWLWPVVALPFLVLLARELRAAGSAPRP